MHSAGGEEGGDVREELGSLQTVCTEMATALSDRCGGDDEAIDEFSGDCERNASERNPGGHTVASGTACIEELEQLDCENPPLNCEDNLAIVACDDYLDGQTTDTCQR